MQPDSPICAAFADKLRPDISRGLSRGASPAYAEAAGYDRASVDDALGARKSLPPPAPTEANDETPDNFDRTVSLWAVGFAVASFVTLWFFAT